jgi:hypothetical protein
MPNDSAQFELSLCSPDFGNAKRQSNQAAYEVTRPTKMRSFFDAFPDIADIRVRVSSTKSPNQTIAANRLAGQ